jgi:glyoxylase-like metal-dependent hydrolase (beta-lactamase superfamily II)
LTTSGTNTYLVGTGPRRILIDTGEGLPHWIETLKRVLSEENATLSAALVSHWHHDHVGGIPHIRAAFPSIKVHKHDPDEGQVNITDGEVFSVEGATLKAIFTPGHTQDHMAFVLEEEDAMFTADNVLGHGTAVFEDLVQYVSSLKNMRTLFGGRAYPGHGDVIADGKARITEYIAHRQQREDQVFAVLNSKKSTTSGTDSPEHWTGMDIVKVIYKDVPENLHLPALGGVLQVLGKLRDEGKVLEDDEGSWSVKYRPNI